MTSSENLLATLAAPGQPERLYRALDDAFQQAVGHRLYTLLIVAGDEVARVHSNRPEEYPVSGRKPMGPTPWGAHVLKGMKPYLGRDKDGVRWAFFDHALIERMGLGSTLNLPVVYDGTCLGTVNLLHVEHHYRDEHIAKAAALVPLLVAPFLIARQHLATSEHPRAGGGSAG